MRKLILLLSSILIMLSFVSCKSAQEPSVEPISESEVLDTTDYEKEVAAIFESLLDTSNLDDALNSLDSDEFSLDENITDPSDTPLSGDPIIAEWGFSKEYMNGFPGDFADTFQSDDIIHYFILANYIPKGTEIFYCWLYSDGEQEAKIYEETFVMDEDIIDSFYEFHLNPKGLPEGNYSFFISWGTGLILSDPVRVGTLTEN